MKYNKRKGKSSITKLAKQVKALTKEARHKRITVWTRNDGPNLTTNLTSPLTIQYLSKFSTDQPIFGTDPNDLEGSKILLKSMTLKIDVRLENLSETEEETQNIEMFVVSLKDEANDILDETTGVITLTPDVHYYRYGAVYNMISFVNKKYFNVHHHDRFTLTNYGSALTTSGAQSLDGTDRRIDFKLPINKIIDAPLSNTVNQSWKTLVCPRDPSKNYFILWFNDNNAGDGEFPRVTTVALKKFEKLDN